MSGRLVLAGKYALLRQLGRGGMAEVFLARHTGMAGFEKLVVVKRTLPELMDDATFKEMFLDEARTAADLRHPSIVSVLEVGEDRGQLFQVMEFLHGQDLGRILARCSRRRQPPPLGHALFIAMGVASALDYAHTKTDLQGRPLGIVHRDVSPQNIVLTYNGVPALVDFGIAAAATQRHITQVGEIRGKVAYISPEQIDGVPVDGRADQFALGVVLYELTTLRPLFRRPRAVDSLRAILRGDVPPPSSVLPGYPADLEEVVLRALARDPDRRFPDCGALHEALEEVADRHRLRLSRRRVGHWLRVLFADEVEDDRQLAHMPTLDAIALEDSSRGETPEPTGPSPFDEPSPDQATRRIDGDGGDDDGAGGPTRFEGTPPRASDPGDPGEVDLVGQTALLDEATALLDGDVTWLTLHGPGGSGRTRLSQEVARRLEAAQRFAPVVVALGPARGPDEVTSAVASALQVGLLTGASFSARLAQLDRAVGAVAAAGAVPLLVLDDVTPALLPAVRQLVATCREGSPALRVLATAEHLLGVAGEVGLAIPPLEVPREGASLEEIEASAAGALFLQSARDLQPDLVVGANDAPHLVALLRRMGGTPLAVRVLAGQLAHHSLAELAATAGLGVAAPEGRGADDAVRFALRRLERLPRALLQLGAALPGGFTLTTAVHALTPSETDVAIAQALDELQAGALLHLRESRVVPGERRFHLPSSIERHVEELGALDEATLLRVERRLLAASLDQAHHIDGPGGGRLFRRLALEARNLLVILERALRGDASSVDDVSRALTATLALDPVLCARGFTTRQLALIDRALETARARSDTDPKLLALALEARADAHKAAGSLSDALLDYQGALEQAQKAGDAWFAGVVYRNIADVLVLLERPREAFRACERALTIFHDLGDRHFEARVHLTQARALRIANDARSAAEHLATALDIFRHVGDRRFEGRALYELGALSEAQGEADRALELYDAALRLHLETGDRRRQARAQLARGGLLRRRNREREANVSLERAWTLTRETGDRRTEGRVLHQLGLLAADRGDAALSLQRLEEAERAHHDVGDARGLRATRAVLEPLRRGAS